MSELNDKAILDALKVVRDPDLDRDIVALGFIKNLKSASGNVSFDIELTTPACPVKDQMKAQALAAVEKIPGVKSVEITMTAQVRSGTPGSDPTLIPLVKNTIAIASGKGGVGKSTVSTNLAIALSQTGAKVGLFDADIYGPNIPQMMGIDEGPKNDGVKIIPARSRGIPIMSMAFMLQGNQPVIWRGPMLHGAIKQFLGQVEWGELDYLVIDLPPGTGDVQLSLCQTIPLTGAVIVTTPQEISLSDVRKGVAMFNQLKVPLLGVIENMSGFVCPHCNEETALYPGHGGEDLVKEFNTVLLGKLPFDTSISQGGDKGEPILIKDPQSKAAKIFREAAGTLAREVAKATYAKTEGHLKLGQIRL